MSIKSPLGLRHAWVALIGSLLAVWGTCRLASVIFPLVAAGGCLGWVLWDLSRDPPEAP